MDKHTSVVSNRKINPNCNKKKKIRSSSRGGGESPLFFKRSIGPYGTFLESGNILQLRKYGLCEGHNKSYQDSHED